MLLHTYIRKERTFWLQATEHLLVKAGRVYTQVGLFINIACGGQKIFG